MAETKDQLEILAQELLDRALVSCNVQGLKHGERLTIVIQGNNRAGATGKVHIKRLKRLNHCERELTEKDWLKIKRANLTKQGRAIMTSLQEKREITSKEILQMFPSRREGREWWEPNYINQQFLRCELPYRIRHIGEDHRYSGEARWAVHKLAE